MLAKVRSGALLGVDAVVVEVEVDMSLGMPFTNVVGLAEGAVKESRVRVQAALRNCGFTLPSKKVTVNLAPAEIRKEGAIFELPLALGILAAANQLPTEPLQHWLFGGELSLDGAVKPIRGVLSLALAARDHGFKGVMVPKANAAEAALVENIVVLPVAHVREAVAHLTEEELIVPYDRAGAAPMPGAASSHFDMADVIDQEELKLALEIAAAGGHNVLMCGPPGSGKTMLARRLPSILPPLQEQEVLEVTRIYSVLGLLKEGQLVRERPFRNPHHTISDAGLVGGGPTARPGELSLAHRGVLFLDELPEFRRNVLEVLRQPLEEGIVRLARANQNLSYPCRVMLVAAMNPCPCGFFATKSAVCSCGKDVVPKYHAKVSGPLLDRIDVTLETLPPRAEFLSGSAPAMPKRSQWYRERVQAARERQSFRFKDYPEVLCNAQMGVQLVREHCVLSPAAMHLLETKMKEQRFSARALDRIKKLARSRADLEGSERIRDEDLAVALKARMIDKAWFERGAGVSQRQMPNSYEANQQRKQITQTGEES